MNAPDVLMLVGRRGWAVDHKAQALQRFLRGRFAIRIGYDDELREEDFDQADAIVAHAWQLPGLADYDDVLQRNAAKLAVGVVSHAALDDPERRPELLERLATLPRLVFANNRRLVAQLHGHLDRPVFYLPNGVDTTLFTPGPFRHESPLRVGWAGSLENHGDDLRGVSAVIRPAVDALDGVELVLAAREDRLRPHVEMPAFFRSLDVYVCASRSEGTPNPCFEASACGIPVVSTRVGNMPELVADGVNGFLVERSVEQLRDRLEQLRDSAQLRRRFRAAMLDVIPAWSWERQSLQYAQMLDALLQSGPVSRPVRARKLGPARPRALAVLSSRNEQRYIAQAIEHWHAHGVSVHLIDNDSEDATVEIARTYLGRGVQEIERFPYEGEFDWRAILERKEEVAAEFAGEWAIHASPDEFFLPPVGYRTLVDALAGVSDQWNAIDVAEFTFVPTREHPDHDHPDFRETMLWYYPCAPRDIHRPSIWRTDAGPARFAASGGHRLELSDLRLSPVPFRMKHYMLLSKTHAEEKYGRRVHSPAALANGWHGWREQFDAESIELPSESELKLWTSDAELDGSNPRGSHFMEWAVPASRPAR